MAQPEELAQKVNSGLLTLPLTFFSQDPLMEKEGSILSWMLNDGEISGLGIMESSL